MNRLQGKVAIVTGRQPRHRARHRRDVCPRGSVGRDLRPQSRTPWTQWRARSDGREALACHVGRAEDIRNWWMTPSVNSGASTSS